MCSESVGTRLSKSTDRRVSFDRRSGFDGASSLPERAVQLTDLGQQSKNP